MKIIATKFRLYWPLIKSLQTGLLLMTGMAGYLSAHASVHWNSFLQMIPSLFLAISGSTILNMWWDRDIDAKMKRTHKRPTSAGQITPAEVLRLGLIISIIGIGWAFWVNLLYGLVVFAGSIFRCGDLQHMAQASNLLGYRLGRNFRVDAGSFGTCAGCRQDRSDWHSACGGNLVLDPDSHIDL